MAGGFTDRLAVSGGSDSAHRAVVDDLLGYFSTVVWDVIDAAKTATEGATWADSLQPGRDVLSRDYHALFKLVFGDMERWTTEFESLLGDSLRGRQNRTFAHELRDWRNVHAHRGALTAEDVARVADTAYMFLTYIGHADASKFREVRDTFRRSSPPAAAARTVAIPDRGVTDPGDLLGRVRLYLEEHPGASARAMVDALGADKKELNRLLYARDSLFRVEKVDVPRWFLR
jgi:hypothetical protein